MTPNDLKRIMRDRAKELGLSKADLSRRSSLSPSQITRLLKPSAGMHLNTLFKLLKALDLKLTCEVKK
jgi:transcriptional regulator with XRE-family HTH domain